MANATIKITALPNIGNALTTSAIFPVVANVDQTDKVTLANVGNLILTEAGNTLEPAFLSTLAYSITNAAQPNITSVGTLTSLDVSGDLILPDITNLKIDGGTDGYVIQTDGTGNLSWVSQTTPNDYGNANVANYLPTYSGDLSPTNVHVTTNALLGDNATAGQYYVYRDSNQVSIGRLGSQTIDVNSNGITIGSTLGVKIEGVSGSNVTVGGGTTGNVVMPDGITFGDGSYQNTAYTGVAGTSIENGLSAVSIPTIDGNVIVNVNDGEAEWQFRTDGALEWPDGSFQGTAFVGMATTAEGLNKDGNISVTISDGLTTVQEWTFTNGGSIVAPYPNANSFPLTLSETYYVPRLAKPVLELTGDPWELTAQYAYAANGDVELQVNNIFPELNNPGYGDGDEFAFDSSVTGIPGYTLTLTLDNVVQAGPAGWTASLGFSQPFDYPSTLKSLGAIRISSDLNNWTFGTDGHLTFPDNTVYTGSSINTSIGSAFAVTTTSSTLPTVSAECYMANPNQFVAWTEFNDDITAVQAGWTVVIDSTTYTVDSVDASVGNMYKINVLGATFFTGDTYTFTNPTPLSYSWVIGEEGQLIAPGSGTISQVNNDFKIEVTGTDIIDLRTGGGDLILDAEGNLNINGPIVSTTGVSQLNLSSGNVILTSTENQTTSFSLNSIQARLYAGVDVNVYAGTIIPALETDYTDSRIMLEESFTLNSGEPGYPWGITLPVSEITYNELIQLPADTFPNQAACTVQANNTQNTWELWQDTIAQSNVTISSNEFNWTFDSEGNLTAPGNIVPDTDIAYDLGNSTHRWRDLYLSGNTIWLGVFTKLSGTSDGALYVPGGISGGGSIVGAASVNTYGITGIVSADKKTVTFSPAWDPEWTLDPVLTGPNHSPYFPAEQIGTDATYVYDKTGTEINSLTLASGGSGYNTTLVDTDIWYFSPNPAEPMTVTGVRAPTSFYYLVVDSSVGTAQHTATKTIDGDVWQIVYTLTPGVGPNVYVVNPATTAVTCNGSAVTDAAALAQLYNYDTFYVYLSDLTSLSTVPPVTLPDNVIEFTLNVDKAWFNTDTMVTLAPLFGAGSTTTQGNTTIVGSSTVTGNQSISENLSVSGNTVLGNTTLSGNTTFSQDLTVSGNAVISGNLTVSPDSIHMGEITFSAPDGNLIIAANTANWTFDQDGNLTFPNGSKINMWTSGNSVELLAGADSSNGGFIALSGGYGNVNGGDAAISGGYSFSTTGGKGGNVTILGGSTAGPDSNSHGNILFGTGGHTWRLENNGAMIFPSSVQTDDLFTITGYSTPSLNSSGNIQLLANAGGATEYGWTFSNNGNLTVPLNILSSGASPAPYLYHFDFIGWNGNIKSESGAFVIEGNTISSTGLGCDVNIEGGAGAGTGNNANGGNVNITGGSSVDGDSKAGNINITSGSNSWIFDNTARLSIPWGGVISTPDSTGGAGGFNIGISGGASDPTVWNTNPGGNVNIQGGYGSYNDGSGAIGGSVNIYGGQSPENTSGNVTINTGPITEHNWIFDNTGNLTIPGSSGGFIKTEANASIAIAAVDNGTNNPAQMMSFNQGLGAPTTIISAYASNATIQSNVTGTMKTWSFDNAGNLTIPGSIIGGGGSITQGAMQLAVYNNTTERDSAITSPQAGMMIYVISVGMQVYGATQWNTIAGSGT